MYRTFYVYGVLSIIRIKKNLLDITKYLENTYI